MNAWLTVNPGWMAAPVRTGFGFLVFTDHACSDRTELGAQEQVIVIQRPDITSSTSGETVQSSVGVLWISISNGRGHFAPKQQVRVLLTGHAWWTGRHLHESNRLTVNFLPLFITVVIVDVSLLEAALLWVASGAQLCLLTLWVDSFQLASR